jgi:hypothetical protein
MRNKKYSGLINSGKVFSFQKYYRKFLNNQLYLEIERFVLYLPCYIDCVLLLFFLNLLVFNQVE